MISVKETSPGVFERLVDNPVLLTLDGKVKAPLRTILAPSWTDEDRARFGVHLVEPFIDPDDMTRVGMPSYIRDGSGRVVEIYEVEEAPAKRPDPLDELRAQVEALALRVAALEVRS